MQRGFGSDNHSAVHPQILESILKANTGHAPSYGTDEWSNHLNQKIRSIFGANAIAFPVFNGTGANVTALKAIVQSFESVLCSEVSHLFVDECGAPEHVGGFKLIPLPHQHGKIEPNSIERVVTRLGDQHAVQPGVLSLTQPTELGTCYSLKELKNLVAMAKSKGLLVHMDGARLANAAYELGLSMQQLTSDLGIDVLSFGGTKNGLMMGELVVFLNPEYARSFKYIRKQCLQLPSKTRFLSAQFLAYFENELWRDIAEHSCQMAERLHQGLLQYPEVEITRPRQSNAVFAIFPKNWVKPLKETCFFYVWDELSFECRLMTGWDTGAEEIQNFLKKIENLRSTDLAK